MKRVTLAVVAVLLAVPAVAQAKAGIEFDDAIQSKTPQAFSAFVHGSGGGGRPLVTFRNRTTGEVVRVRTSPLNRVGVALGTVVLPDHGPWTATLSLNGKVLSPAAGQGFEAPAPAARPAAPPRSHDGGLPAWLLSIPAALAAALAIRLLRRRPRELGA